MAMLSELTAAELQNHDTSVAPKTRVRFESATTRLVDTILGDFDQDLAETLREIASKLGLRHIAYLRLSPDKSADICLLVAVVTYSRLWQHRYFVKKYINIDPVISYGRQTANPFDWAELLVDDPSTKAFFADALNHSVGGVFALVSFTSDLSKGDWELYKTNNMKGLRLLSVLIDSAANINFKLPSLSVHLSTREEQCLLWAARGKTYEEIAEILGVAFGSVKTHLDGARHKLRCLNLTHAAAVALATGVIPAQALKW
jgi:DNA-binding CsgD family transcriptional regulator